MKLPKIDADRVRRLAPLAAPVAVLAVAWLLILEPRAAESRRAEAEIASLQPRLTRLMSFAGRSVPQAAAVPAVDVARRLPESDPMPDVLERLARLALAGSEHGAIANLLIETGEQVDASAGATAPRVAASSQPDPRLALLEVPFAYTPVTVSFESAYARLGQYLWELRDLPALIEIQSLDVRPAGAETDLVRVAMVLFTYRRATTAAPSAQQSSRTVSSAGQSGGGE